MIMIDKNIDDISFTDIMALQENKVEESDTLDYKQEVVDDSKLLNLICAFANTKGGDIVIGIKESGDGGYPEEICGIDANALKKEHIERIVLSSITPQLDIKIRKIQIDNSDKYVTVIRIPDSYIKPYQNKKNHKFYKRHQFSVAAMTEQEVYSHYKTKITTHDTVEQYIKDMEHLISTVQPDDIVINTIIIPLNTERRLIDTSDSKKLNWMTKLKFDPVIDNRSYYFLPFYDFCGHGIMYKDTRNRSSDETIVHRNGCIQDIQCYKRCNILPTIRVGERLIHTLQFGAKVLQHYGYYGEVRIRVKISSASDVTLPVNEFYKPSMKESCCTIDRMHTVQYISTSYIPLAKSIMDEVFNHFGCERCDIFDSSN